MRLRWPWNAGNYLMFSCTDAYVKRLDVVHGGLQIDLDIGQVWFCPTAYRTYFDFRARTNPNSLTRIGSNGMTVIIKGPIARVSSTGSTVLENTTGGITAEGVDVSYAALQSGEVEIIAPDRVSRATIDAGKIAIVTPKGIIVKKAPSPVGRFERGRFITHPTNKGYFDGVERKQPAVTPRVVTIESLTGEKCSYRVHQVSKETLELSECTMIK